MIYYFTPYQHKNLGEAYNHYCSLVLNDDDWITIMDGDVMQLHLNWGEMWEKILSQNNDAGIVTCMTNRVHYTNDFQLCKSMFNNNNIIDHKLYAIELFKKYEYQTKNVVSKFMSGFYFSFKKSTWKTAGGFADGILDVDKNFFLNVIKFKPCKIALGYYILHYYRMYEGDKYLNHLTKS